MFRVSDDKRKTPIANNLDGQKQFASIYITYTLLMEAQVALNEDALDDGLAAQILADFNDIDIEYQAPINHIDDYMRDYMMDKNKARLVICEDPRTS